MAEQAQGAGAATPPKVGDVRQGTKGMEQFVKQGGKSGWMPASEVAAGFSRTDDYTRKTQALAKRELELTQREKVLTQAEANLGRQGPEASQQSGFDGEFVPPDSYREQLGAAGSNSGSRRSNVDPFEELQDNPAGYVQRHVRAQMGPVMQQVETMRQQNEALQLQVATQQGKQRLRTKYPDIDFDAVEAAIEAMPVEAQGEFRNEVGYSLLHREMKDQGTEQGAGDQQEQEGKRTPDSTPYVEEVARSSAQLPGGIPEPLPDSIRPDDRAAMTKVGEMLAPKEESPPGG